MVLATRLELFQIQVFLGCDEVVPGWFGTLFGIF